MDTVTQTKNQVIVSDEFYGDETLLTSHETPSFYFLAMSVKVLVFNVMKPFMKLPLKLIETGLKAGQDTIKASIFIEKDSLIKLVITLLLHCIAFYLE